MQDKQATVRILELNDLNTVLRLLYNLIILKPYNHPTQDQFFT